MKKVIHGKRYDTNTATELAYYSNLLSKRDFKWCEETLYRKQGGEFFLHGAGGGLSAYAQAYPNTGYGDGEQIIPMSEESARQWCEMRLSYDEYVRIFGEVEE